MAAQTSSTTVLPFFLEEALMRYSTINIVVDNPKRSANSETECVQQQQLRLRRELQHYDGQELSASIRKTFSNPLLGRSLSMGPNTGMTLPAWRNLEKYLRHGTVTIPKRVFDRKGKSGKKLSPKLTKKSMMNRWESGPTTGSTSKLDEVLESQQQQRQEQPLEFAVPPPPLIKAMSSPVMPQRRLGKDSSVPNPPKLTVTAAIVAKASAKPSPSSLPARKPVRRRSLTNDVSTSAMIAKVLDEFESIDVDDSVSDVCTLASIQTC